MKMHNESRWWHQQSRNRVCDQYCGEIQDLVLIKTHIQISSLNNSLPLTSLQKPLDLGNELFGWWNKYLHKENISKGLDIWERLRKWEKWDKFVRLSVMFADAVGGPGVGIANVPPRGRPEGNMQNEMKTPTDLGSDWCRAENWKRGTATLAGGAKFQTRELAFSTGVTCADPCQLALSMSRWVETRILPRPHFLHCVFITTILIVKVFDRIGKVKRPDVTMCGLNLMHKSHGVSWQVLCLIGWVCPVSVNYICYGWAPRDGCSGVGLLTKRMEGLWKGCVKRVKGVLEWGEFDLSAG